MAPYEVALREARVRLSRFRELHRVVLEVVQDGDLAQTLLLYLRLGHCLAIEPEPTKHFLFMARKLGRKRAAGGLGQSVNQ